MAMYGAKSSRRDALVVFDPSMVRDDPRTRSGRSPTCSPTPTAWPPSTSRSARSTAPGWSATRRSPASRAATTAVSRSGSASAGCPSAAPASRRRPLRTVLSGPRPDRDRYLSVNVSPEALQSPEVQSALAGDLTGLVIEITEHNELDGEQLLKAVAPLRAAGRGSRSTTPAPATPTSSSSSGCAPTSSSSTSSSTTCTGTRRSAPWWRRWCPSAGAPAPSCAPRASRWSRSSSRWPTWASAWGRAGSQAGRSRLRRGAGAGPRRPGGQTFGAGPDDLSPVLARIEASPVLFDLGGAVRAGPDLPRSTTWRCR